MLQVLALMTQRLGKKSALAWFYLECVCMFKWERKHESNCAERRAQMLETNPPPPHPQPPKAPTLTRNTDREIQSLHTRLASICPPELLASCRLAASFSRSPFLPRPTSRGLPSCLLSIHAMLKCRHGPRFPSQKAALGVSSQPVDSTLVCEGQPGVRRNRVRRC